MPTFLRTLSLASVLAASLVTSPAVHASDALTPTDVKGAKVITVEEGKKLADGKAALFVDTRSVMNYGKGHVPGAIAVAYKEKSDKVPDFDKSADSFDFAKLPKDKAAPVVFYSDGPSGWKSYKAAVLAVNAGYSNVRYMRGGYSDWTAKGLPVEQ